MSNSSRPICKSVPAIVLSESATNKTSPAKGRKLRSLSVSSDYEPDDSEDGGRRIRKMSPKNRKNGVLPRSKGRDLYIPDYSKLRKGIARSSHALAPSSTVNDTSSTQPVALDVANALKLEPSVEEIHLNASDMEDIISLGGDLEMDNPGLPLPSLVNSDSFHPTVQINILGRGNNGQATSRSVEHLPSLSKKYGSNHDNAASGNAILPDTSYRDRSRRRLATPPYTTVGSSLSTSILSRSGHLVVPVLSTSAPELRAKRADRRLSAVTQHRTQVRISDAKSSTPAAPATGQLRRGIVSGDLKARLMVRLEEEMKLKVKETLKSSPSILDDKENKEEISEESQLNIPRTRLSTGAVDDAAVAVLMLSGSPPLPNSSKASSTELTASQSGLLPSTTLTTPFARQETRLHELQNRVAKEKALAATKAASFGGSLSRKSYNEEGHLLNGDAGKPMDLLARIEKEKKLARLRSKLIDEKAVLQQA